MTRDIISAVQNLLLALGYRPGRLDGTWNRDTELEIRQFQLDHGLPIDGQISGELLRRLAEEIRRQLRISDGYHRQ